MLVSSFESGAQVKEKPVFILLTGTHMALTSLLFYPKDYIGFNKAGLLERRLLAEGVLGVKCESSTAFCAGYQFWRFIPKDINLQKSPLNIPRISIHSVGVWALLGRPAILERANTLLIEGDLSGVVESTGKTLCGLLQAITGDEYAVAFVPATLGIAETSKRYKAKVAG